MEQRLPRSVYFHVPFCGRRCGYCNFTLVTGRDDLIAPYLDALAVELSRELSGKQEVDTIFLGGGTPSYLSEPELAQLMNLISDWFTLRDGGEFSCEANPLDCSLQQLRTLRHAGVNRISLGAQSFQAEKLKTLERDHKPSDLSPAITRCCEFFGNVSLDLIFAAPGETLDDWRRDLAAATSHPIQHLSCYGLTVERGAAFYGRVQKQQLAEVDDETQLAMYQHAREHLQSIGFEHYEVSNFARRGFVCKHNETYWLGQPWFAFGPGAASYTVLPDPSNFPSIAIPGALLDRAEAIDVRREQGAAGCHAGLPIMVRRVNHRSTTTYIRRLLKGESPVAEFEPISPEQQLRERLVFGLRRRVGVDLQDLNAWWGGDCKQLFAPHIDRYIQNGWLCQTGSNLSLTDKGLVISDSLWPDLLQ